jgi:hypothetical protein
MHLLDAMCPEIVGECEEMWRTLLNPWVRSIAGNVLITWENIMSSELSRHSDGLRVGQLGFDFRQRQETSLSFAVCIPALGSTQLLLQHVPFSLSPGVNLTTHLHLVPRSRMVELYDHHHPARDTFQPSVIRNGGVPLLWFLFLSALLCIQINEG